uniref:Uncharacterized protein n=1 Tax=Malus domestica TaxID=3750 RepID=G0XZB2_MALDO|nr:hypothetical protein [Malus domestica]
MDDELLPVWMFLPAYALRMQMFFLDKWSGKKCYMISARDFMIPWGDAPDKWGWHSVADSRFEEVAELRSVWWLEIRGNIETRILSPSRVYQAYLVFKLSATADGFDRDDSLKVTVGLLGEEEVSSKRAVFLDQEEVPVGTSETQYPKKRTDGWLEMEMGEFFCPGEEDGAIMEMLVWRLIIGLKVASLFRGLRSGPRERRKFLMVHFLSHDASATGNDLHATGTRT